MIRQLKSGRYRLYSRKKNPRTGKRRNLGTFLSRAAAERHERAVQYFKRHGEVPMTRLGCTIVLVAALVAGGANQLTAQEQDHERKVTRKDLPAAVAKTVDAQSHGARIRGYSEERGNGQTFYEVELRVNGHTRDVLIDTNGAVVEVEEEVALASLPAAG